MQKIIQVLSLIVAALLSANLYATQAGQILTPPGLSLNIDNETGNISHVSVINSPEAMLRHTDLFVNGNLLSLDWKTQPRLHSNQILKDDNGQPFLESRYIDKQGLNILRRVKGGASPYSLSISYAITNSSTELIDLSSRLKPSFYFASGFKQFIDEGGGYGAWVYGYRYLFIRNNNGTQIIDIETLNNPSVLDTTQWIGWANRHHVIAIQMTPPKTIGIDTKETLSNMTEMDNKLTPASLALAYAQPELSLPKQLLPGQSTSISFNIMIAPKQWDELSLTTPALDSVVLINLWDWFRSICFALWQLLSLLFTLSGSWGVSIILMALIVRIMIIPITRISLHYQENSIQQQERIKPLIKKIREDYEGIELSQQLVALYEREKYDHLAPFKGMLALFIQIPILIALFNTLGEAPELNGVPFLWFHDLSLSDRLLPLGIDLPFFGAYLNLLPFLMAGITVLSTLYAAQTSKNHTPISSLFGMAALFFILFYSFPSGLVLYWLFSTFFQLLQQIIENKIK